MSWSYDFRRWKRGLGQPALAAVFAVLIVWATQGNMPHILTAAPTVLALWLCSKLLLIYLDGLRIPGVDRALSRLEGIFPLVEPEVHGDYIPAHTYYFLDDKSGRYGQRILALLCTPVSYEARREVSFWRRREFQLGLRDN